MGDLLSPPAAAAADVGDMTDLVGDEADGAADVAVAADLTDAQSLPSLPSSPWSWFSSTSVSVSLPLLRVPGLPTRLSCSSSLLLSWAALGLRRGVVFCALATFKAFGGRAGVPLGPLPPAATALPPACSMRFRLRYNATPTPAAATTATAKTVPTAMPTVLLPPPPPDAASFCELLPHAAIICRAVSGSVQQSRVAHVHGQPPGGDGEGGRTGADADAAGGGVGSSAAAGDGDGAASGVGVSLGPGPLGSSLVGSGDGSGSGPTDVDADLVAPMRGGVADGDGVGATPCTTTRAMSNASTGLFVDDWCTCGETRQGGG